MSLALTLPYPSGKDPLIVLPDQLEDTAQDVGLNTLQPLIVCGAGQKHQPSGFRLEVYRGQYCKGQRKPKGGCFALKAHRGQGFKSDAFTAMVKQCPDGFVTIPFLHNYGMEFFRPGQPEIRTYICGLAFSREYVPLASHPGTPYAVKGTTTNDISVSMMGPPLPVSRRGNIICH